MIWATIHGRRGRVCIYLHEGRTNLTCFQRVSWRRMASPPENDFRRRESCPGAETAPENPMAIPGWFEMNHLVCALSSLPLLAGTALAGHAQAVTEIGGQTIVKLTRDGCQHHQAGVHQHHSRARPRHGDSADHRQLSRQGQCRRAGLARSGRRKEDARRGR